MPLGSERKKGIEWEHVSEIEDSIKLLEYHVITAINQLVRK